MSPKVSVIIPVYNVESYLQRSLDSVINQTLKDIEIICINDGSTDNSLDILKEYASKDKRIKIIDLAVNQGVANARNIALENANGEYVGFVDPDDYIDLNFYEELYKKAQETDADIAKGVLVEEKVNGETKISKLNERIVEKSKFHFTYELPSAIFKFPFISDNNIIFMPDLKVEEDVVFLHEAILNTKKVEIAGNVNYYYIRRHNSLNDEIYDKTKMDSAYKTVLYIAEMYNRALNKQLSSQVYLIHYVENMHFLIDYTIKKTNDKELKIKCIEIFTELFEKCLLRSELEDIFRIKYDKILDFIKSKDNMKLYEIYQKYKNFLNYCQIENLKNKVKKDLKNEQSICNYTGI